MAAGTKYNLTPDYKPEELYRVETGVRKSGPWKLDTTNLTAGYVLPPFTPVEADLKTRTIVPVRNFLIEGTAVDEEGNPDATKVRITDGSLAYVGMFIGDGKNGAQVTSIEKVPDSKAVILNLSKAYPGTGPMIFEATAEGGTKKKNTANFVTYDAKKVETDGPVLCTLLMQAYEVKESKLHVPIHELDKVGLTCRFQFEY